MRHITPKHRNKEICDLIAAIYKRVKNTRKNPKSYSDEYWAVRYNFLAEIRKLGFKLVGSGAYKLAYVSPDYPEFIVKVYKYMDSYENDTLLRRLPSFLRKHFLFPIYKNRVYMIQPRANGKKGKWKKYAYNAFYEVLKEDENLIEMCHRHDVCYNNIKYHDGQPVVIDFC